MGLTFLKLGGSLVTDKSTPYTTRPEAIERLASEIASARRVRHMPLLVGNGAGSFAHVSAARHRAHLGIAFSTWQGFAEVHHDALRLSTIIREALTRAGETAVTIQPSASCITRSGRIAELATRPVAALLEAGVIPVVYGDMCIDEEQGCAIASTEEVFRHLASVLSPSRIVMAAKVDGVLDASGRLVERITPAALPSLREALASSDATDVTGGMLHKVEEALATGVPTLIVNGMVPGRLERALLGEPVPCTAISG
jgi:isopentenyl phosphate kinase